MSVNLKTYKDCEEFLNSSGISQTGQKYPEGHELRRTKHVLELLSNPQNKYKTIHVTGTSGKTSTCNLIAQVLTKSGYKTGLTTSPHLQVVTERIQINGQFISEEDFIDLLNQVGPLFLDLGKNPNWGQPSSFEMMTILAFEYFAQSKVDIAIIEVGIGGKFDCTNVITPILSIITNVGLDHTELLGNTIEEITLDKREIIKPGVPVITGATQEGVLRLIEEKAKEVGSKVFRVIPAIESGTMESYQDLNKEIALAAIKELRLQGYRVEQGDPSNSIKDFKMPGRMEVVSNNPLIILDGAHNTNKMKATVDSLRNQYKYKFNIVYKTLNPQHSTNMLKELLPITKKFFIINHDLQFLPSFTSYEIFSSLLEAFSTAKQLGLPVLVTGSIYTVREIRNLFFKPEELIKNQSYYL